MTTLKQSILDSAKELQQELDTLLEGMDYCLDWKQDDDEWSTRELLWHILEDPEGRHSQDRPGHPRRFPTGDNDHCRRDPPERRATGHGHGPDTRRSVRIFPDHGKRSSGRQR